MTPVAYSLFDDLSKVRLTSWRRARRAGGWQRRPAVALVLALVPSRAGAQVVTATRAGQPTGAPCKLRLAAR